MSEATLELPEMTEDAKHPGNGDVEAGASPLRGDRADSEYGPETIMSDCGFCLAGHFCVRQVLTVLWLLTLPVRFVESIVVSSPTWVLARVIIRNGPITLAGFVVGVALSYGCFAPLARMSHYNAVCTSYLSLLAWCLANMLINIMAVDRLITMSSLKTLLCCANSGSVLVSMGEAGYLGMTGGLLIAFGDVAFQPRPADEKWIWCRASNEWPAEPVYLLVFALACANAYVRLTSLEDKSAAYVQSLDQDEESRQTGDFHAEDVRASRYSVT